MLVYDQQPPYRGVEIRTTAVLSEIGDRAFFRELAVRYLGNEAGVAYAAALPDTLILVRLKPGFVRSWDFADDFPAG